MKMMMLEIFIASLLFFCSHLLSSEYVERHFNQDGRPSQSVVRLCVGCGYILMGRNIECREWTCLLACRRQNIIEMSGSAALGYLATEFIWSFFIIRIDFRVATAMGIIFIIDHFLDQLFSFKHQTTVKNLHPSFPDFKCLVFVRPSKLFSSSSC